MSGTTKQARESESSIPATPQREALQEGFPEAERERRRRDREGGKLRESKVHRISAGGKPLYTPQARAQKKPRLLTVDQYLKNAKHGEGEATLIRSLHKTGIMSFAEWERESAALLKKKIW